MSVVYKRRRQRLLFAGRVEEPPYGFFIKNSTGQFVEILWAPPGSQIVDQTQETPPR